jgi:hypothetical protein
MKVGIVIPYNKDRGWLYLAKQSIERQTYTGEIYVSEQHSDNLVGVNLNNGIKDCLDQGCDIIRYLCEDDTLTIYSIESTVEYFNENEDVDFMHSNARNFYHNSNRPDDYQTPRKTDPTIEDMLSNNVLHGGTVVYRARVFEECEFNETLWTAEEYEFNMRIMVNGCKLGYLDSITYNYRLHPKQKSIGIRDVEYQADREQVKQTVKGWIRELL